MATIANGKNRPLTFQTGTVPDVGGAMLDWFQPLVFSKVVKVISAFQVTETMTPVSFHGVIQPLTERNLSLKPEGQRAWSWFLVHASPSLTLQVDDVGVFLGKQTRVMSRKDYALYGYVEYHWCQDWTGSGPDVPVVTSDYDGGDAFTTVFETDLDGGSSFVTGDDVDGGNAFAS